MMNTGTRRDVHEAGYVAAQLAPGAVEFIRTITSVITIVLSWVSTSLEVFVRHSFGERYLNLVKLYLAWTVIGFLNMFVWSFAQPTIDKRFLFFTLGFTPLFLILSCYHLWQIRRRNKASILWHSMSFGVSRLEFLIGKKVGPFTITDWTLYRFIEPVTFFVLGLILARFIDPTTGAWLVISSVALALKNQIGYAGARGRELDIMDAKIEQEYMSDAVSGKPKQQTAGFTVVTVPEVVKRELWQNRDTGKLPPI